MEPAEVDLPTLQYFKQSQEEEKQEYIMQACFLLALLRCIKPLPNHFYGFNHDIIFYFQLQITCKLIVFNLPVGLA